MFPMRYYMTSQTTFGVNRNIIWSTGLVFVSSFAFTLGYDMGWRERGSHDSQSPTAEQNSTIVAPLGLGEHTPELPPQQLPVPQVDRHGHPSFDCTRVIKSVPHVEGDQAISHLTQQRKELNGQSIKTSAVVVGVYPNIMGTNWYHLCDEPNGDVLVVSANFIAQPGEIVHVKGELKLDHEVGGVYRFPLFIGDAQLSGENVQPAKPQRPQGVVEL